MARDLIHTAVKNALIKDGWTITDDPYTLQYEEARLSVDLGAERVLAAERGTEKILVEIKSFLSPSAMHDLELALGQYMVYKGLLKFGASDRELYLAISDFAYEETFTKKAVWTLMREYAVAMFIVNLENEEVTQWIKW